MEFIPVRAFREPSKIWEKLDANKELVITNNGKPDALMIAIDDNFEEVLASIRQAKAMRALNAMRAIARDGGFLSQEEIDAEIRAAREDNA